MEGLEDLVSEHPFDRELQRKYIERACQLCGNQEFSEVCHASGDFVDLDDGLWLKWLEVSTSLPLNEQADVMSLAIFRHPSVSVVSKAIEILPRLVSANWNSWAQFPPRPTSVKSANRFMEEALEKVALWSNSHSVWEACRSFLKSIDAPVDQVRKLYGRQLQSVPMSPEAHQQLSDEQVDFEKQHNIEHVDFSLRTGLDLHSSWADLEKEVLEYPSSWIRMIVERSKSDPIEYVASLHARSVIDCPTEAKMWRMYLQFVDQYLKDAKSKFNLLQRAVLNCPYEGEFWVELVRLSAANPNFERYVSLGTSALRESSHLESNHGPLSKLLLYSATRTLQSSKDQSVIRQSFSDAVSILSGISSAHTVEALLAWLHAEAFHASLVEGGASMIDNLMSEFLSNEAYEDKRIASTPLQWVELAWITQKTYYSDQEVLRVKARSVYQSALHYIRNERLRSVIIQDWSLFERTFGSLQDVFAVERLCHQAVDLKQEPHPKKIADTQPKEQQRPSDRHLPEKKRSREDKDGEKPVLRPHAEVVFVKDMSYSVDEYRLSQFFEADHLIGTPVKVLVVRDNKGKSKGFGYVEFESSDAADKAIALSGQVLEGRSVIISPSTRGITNKRPVVEPPKTFEHEKDKTNDYFRNLILQKQKVHK